LLREKEDGGCKSAAADECSRSKKAFHRDWRDGQL
jgi:hypothetical protein